MRQVVILFVFLVALLVLNGCGNNPARTEVPIPVPCVSKLPAKPEACSPADTSRQEYLRCALADCERRRGYTDQLEAALVGCVGDSK